MVEVNVEYVVSVISMFLRSLEAILLESSTRLLSSMILSSTTGH